MKISKEKNRLQQIFYFFFISGWFGWIRLRALSKTEFGSCQIFFFYLTKIYGSSSKTLVYSVLKLEKSIGFGFMVILKYIVGRHIISARKMKYIISITSRHLFTSGTVELRYFFWRFLSAEHVRKIHLPSNHHVFE